MSVTAQRTWVAQGMSLSQTVDTIVLVIPQLSVEAKKTTLGYTRFMAQGGNAISHFPHLHEML